MSNSITVEITNKKGLHARAAAKFVKSVGSFNAKILVTKMGEDMPAVHGGSILGLLMLGADPGSKLTITGEGPEATKSLGALKHLIEAKFGEGE